MTPVKKQLFRLGFFTYCQYANMACGLCEYLKQTGIGLHIIHAALR
jgi:hypothetical protein